MGTFGGQPLSWLEEMNRPVLALSSIQSTERGLADRKRLDAIEARVAEIERRLGAGAECVAEEPPLRMLVQMVARFYHVSIEELIGKSRAARVVWPRHVCWWLARHELGLSLSQIQEHFDLLSHGSVLHGCHHVQDMGSVSPQIQREVAELMRMIEEAKL